MTNAFYKSSRLDSAWVYQEKADKLAAKFDSEPQLFNYYQGKASLLNATGRYKEAIPIYHRLLQNYIDSLRISESLRRITVWLFAMLS